MKEAGERLHQIGTCDVVMQLTSRHIHFSAIQAITKSSSSTVCAFFITARASVPNMLWFVLWLQEHPDKNRSYFKRLLLFRRLWRWHIMGNMERKVGSAQENDDENSAKQLRIRPSKTKLHDTTETSPINLYACIHLLSRIALLMFVKCELALHSLQKFLFSRLSSAKQFTIVCIKIIFLTTQVSSCEC